MEENKLIPASEALVTDMASAMMSVLNKHGYTTKEESASIAVNVAMDEAQRRQESMDAVKRAVDEKVSELLPNEVERSIYAGSLCSEIYRYAAAFGYKKQGLTPPECLEDVLIKIGQYRTKYPDMFTWKRCHSKAVYNAVKRKEHREAVKAEAERQKRIIADRESRK